MLFKNIKILDENFTVQDNMNVVTEGEFITYVGSDVPEAEGQEVVDGSRKFLMPAFYNTHCHVPMTLLRGYGEGLPLQRWLNERIYPFEAKFNPEYKYWGAKLGALELMKSGCVSISDMYFNLATYGEGLYEAGMKANLCNCIVCFGDDDSYFEDSAYIDTVELLDWIKNHNDGRIKADASVHSEYATREKAVREACEYAAENNMIMHIHISETQPEHEECKERHGLTPVQYFDKCGAFNTPAIAAHCVWLEDEDVEIMIRKGAFMSHNASSNLKLGSGIAPVKKYYDAGMNITFGTDGASSNNNLNMLEEIHLAAMLARGASRDANAISSAEILRMATLEGAKAQGRTDCGVIAEGKKADLIVFDLDKENLTPDFNTVSNIVFAADTSDIWMTMCDGRVICKEGKSLLIDEEETKAKALESFNKVLASL